MDPRNPQHRVVQPQFSPELGFEPELLRTEPLFGHGSDIIQEPNLYQVQGPRCHGSTYWRFGTLRTSPNLTKYLLRRRSNLSRHRHAELALLPRNGNIIVSPCQF